MAIKTLEQAVSVQTRRYMAGKCGTSKAVRRYLKRVHNTFPDAFLGHFPAHWKRNSLKQFIFLNSHQYLAKRRM